MTDRKGSPECQPDSIALLLPRKRPTNTRTPISAQLERVDASLDDSPQLEAIKKDGKPTAVTSTLPDPNTPPKLNKLDYHYPSSSESKPLHSPQRSNATAEAIYDTATEDDHRARRERAARLHTASLSGHYQGQQNYYQYHSRRDTAHANALSDKNFRAGPQRVATNIRNTCRFDYAPDLCKDYNETGFCGFGDSCKFVHDRGDYKMGWELEREWEERQLGRDQGLADGEDYAIGGEEEATEVEPEPTVCGICDKDFQKPILETKCGHRFCEKCALKVARTSEKCHTCGSPIKGQFKVYKPTTTS